MSKERRKEIRKEKEKISGERPKLRDPRAPRCTSGSGGGGGDRNVFLMLLGSSAGIICLCTFSCGLLFGLL